MSQDSSVSPSGVPMTLVPIRWADEQIARADALAAVTGLPRSVIMRAAFDHGISVMERNVAAVTVPAGQ